jgi:thiol-disulfide isomerase/thioredoxin
MTVIRKLIFFSIFFPMMTSAQQGFKVVALLKGLGENKVRVFTQKNGRVKIDTLSPISGDKIIWEGSLEEPQLVRMEVMDTTLYLRVGRAVSFAPPIMFLLTNTSVNLDGNANEIYSASVRSKDPEMLMYEPYRLKDIENVRATWALQKEHNRKLREMDTVGNGKIMAQMTALRKQNQQNRMQYIDANPNSFASVLMLTNLSLVMSPEDMIRRFDSLDPSIKSSEAGKTLNAKIETNRKTAIGKPVVHFAQTGLDGKMVSTESLKGKVILIDFWGSWCVPCRKSHPGLKDLYTKFKSKGLEIIGISNEVFSVGKTKEEQAEAWKKAIKEDGINWLHILYDPAQNDIVKTYDIMGYPTKYLIDQNGKIVMKFLGSGESQHKELERLLSQLMPD